MIHQRRFILLMMSLIFSMIYVGCAILFTQLDFGGQFLTKRGDLSVWLSDGLRMSLFILGATLLPILALSKEQIESHEAKLPGAIRSTAFFVIVCGLNIAFYTIFICWIIVDALSYPPDLTDSLLRIVSSMKLSSYALIMLNALYCSTVGIRSFIEEQ